MLRIVDLCIRRVFLLQNSSACLFLLCLAATHVYAGGKPDASQTIVIENTSQFEARVKLTNDMERKFLKPGETETITIKNLDRELYPNSEVEYEIPILSTWSVPVTGDNVLISKDQKHFKIIQPVLLLTNSSYFSVLNKDRQSIKIASGRGTYHPFRLAPESNDPKHIATDYTGAFEYDSDKDWSVALLRGDFGPIRDFPFPEIKIAERMLYRFVFDGRKVLLTDARPLVNVGSGTWILQWDKTRVTINAVSRNAQRTGYFLAGSVSDHNFERPLLLFVDNNGAVSREKIYVEMQDDIPSQVRINDIALTGNGLVAVGCRKVWNLDTQTYDSAGWIQHFLDDENLTADGESVTLDDFKELSSVNASLYRILAGGVSKNNQVRIYEVVDEKISNLNNKYSELLDIVNVQKEKFAILVRKDNSGFLLFEENGAIIEEQSMGAYIPKRAILHSHSDTLLVLGTKLQPNGNEAGFMATFRDGDSSLENIKLDENTVFVDGNESPYRKGVSYYIHGVNHSGKLKLFHVHYGDDISLTPFPMHLANATTRGGGRPANDFGYLVLTSGFLGKSLLDGAGNPVKLQYRPGLLENPQTDIGEIDIVPNNANSATLSWQKSTQVLVAFAQEEGSNDWKEAPVRKRTSGTKIELDGLFPGIKYLIKILPLNGTLPEDGIKVRLYEHEWSYKEDGYANYRPFALQVDENGNRYKPRMPVGGQKYMSVERSFRISRNELTWREWDDVYEWAVGNGYVFANRGYGSGDNYPVVNISWLDAVVWCNAASEKYGFLPVFYEYGRIARNSQKVNATIEIDYVSDGFRLPSQAEWVLAAGGNERGDSDPIPGKRSWNANSRIQGRAPSEAREVGESVNRDTGISDMSGNVAEMCLNTESEKYPVRGGSFQSPPIECRIYAPSVVKRLNSVSPAIGFRPARSWIDSLVIVKHGGGSFYLAPTELSWKEWEEVRKWAYDRGYTIAKGQIGSKGNGTDDQPVTMMNWLDAITWCNAASEKNALTPVYTYKGKVVNNSIGGQPVSKPNGIVRDKEANGYRLPTSKEWLVAAQAGSEFQYSGSNNIQDVTVHGGETSPVLFEGILPNAFGFWQMSGNVEEWTDDKKGESRLALGGTSQKKDPHLALDNAVNKKNIQDKNAFTGFRLARNGYRGK